MTEAPETDFGETQKTYIQGAFDITHRGDIAYARKTVATAAVNTF